MKIKKALICIICLMMVISIIPVQLMAAGFIEGETSNLTVSFTSDGTAIKNATFRLYKVADVDRYGKYTLTEAFAESRVDLASHEASHWQGVVEVCEGYISLNKITPDYTCATDANGDAVFNNVPNGLYLVNAAKKQQGGRTYTVNSFLVALPSLDEVENEWIYNVTVIPKFTSKKNGGGGGSNYVNRSVIKVWNDTDYEHKRPKEVTVVLLKDGESYDTVVLSKDNSWKHQWSSLSDEYDWTVAEKDVPEGYKVSVEQNGTAFVITNTYDSDGDKEPVSRQVVKVWDDKGHEKERPHEINIVLKKDGKEIEEIKLSEENNWRYTWNNLDGGSEWAIEEKDVPAKYTSRITKDGIAFIVTNTYKDEESTEPEKETQPTEPDEEKGTVPEKERETTPEREKETEPDKEKGTEPEKETETNKAVDRNVVKIWDDGGDEAGRPEEIVIELLKGDEVVGEAVLNDETGWQYKWSNLEWADWTVREKNVPEGYISRVNFDGTTFVVTNSKILPPVTRTVVKVWNDEGHENERRAVEVALKCNGEVYDTVILSEENGWRYEWTELDGNSEWTLVEVTELDRYTSKVVKDNNEFVVINTYSYIPQTGQLWWPVPMLLACGLMLICLGIIRRRGVGNEK